MTEKIKSNDHAQKEKVLNGTLALLAQKSEDVAERFKNLDDDTVPFFSIFVSGGVNPDNGRSGYMVQVSMLDATDSQASDMLVAILDSMDDDMVQIAMTKFLMMKIGMGDGTDEMDLSEAIKQNAPSTTTKQ